MKPQTLKKKKNVNNPANRQAGWDILLVDARLRPGRVCLCAVDVWANSFLTSCLLVLVSAVPESHQQPGGSQTLWWTERGDTQHSSEKTRLIHSFIHSHFPPFTQSYAPPGWATHQCVLCQRWSTFAPSLLNLQTHVGRQLEPGNDSVLNEQSWAHRCLYSHSLLPPQRDPAGGSRLHYLGGKQVGSQVWTSAFFSWRSATILQIFYVFRPHTVFKHKFPTWNCSKQPAALHKWSILIMILLHL